MLRSPQSCTSELQKWNQPRKRKLAPHSIDYEYGKKNVAQSTAVYDPRPPAMRCTSDSSIQSLRKDLENTGKDIALLHLLSHT